MASEFCLTTLGPAKDFEALDAETQATRLAMFMTDWFGTRPLNTIDMIRYTQRLRVYSAKVGVCVGDLMPELLREAKVMKETGVIIPTETVTVSDPEPSEQVLEPGGCVDVPDESVAAPGCSTHCAGDARPPAPESGPPTKVRLKSKHK